MTSVQFIFSETKRPLKHTAKEMNMIFRRKKRILVPNNVPQVDDVNLLDKAWNTKTKWKTVIKIGHIYLRRPKEADAMKLHEKWT